MLKRTGCLLEKVLLFKPGRVGRLLVLLEFHFLFLEWFRGYFLFAEAANPVSNRKIYVINGEEPLQKICRYGVVKSFDNNIRIWFCVKCIVRNLLHLFFTKPWNLSYGMAR